MIPPLFYILITLLVYILIGKYFIDLFIEFKFIEFESEHEDDERITKIILILFFPFVCIYILAVLFINQFINFK